MAGKSKTLGFLELFAVALAAGGVGAAFLVGIAPYVGLGEDEGFLLYKLYGWTRTLAFYTALKAGAAGAVLFVLLRVIGYVFSAVRSALASGRGVRVWAADAARRLRTRLTPRTLALYVGIVAASALVGYVAFEVFVRYELRREYLRGNHNMFIQTETLNAGPLDQGIKDSEVGVFKENRRIGLWVIGPDNEIAFKNHYRTNNHGFLSEKEYSLERKGNEYRIAVLGDSMTGTTTMPFQWVDLVEDLLNADRDLLAGLGVDAIRVYNFGVPGAGFPHWSEYYEKYAKRFDSDLVVINYIESDFPRMRTTKTVSGHTVMGGFVPYAVGPGPEDVAQLNVTCTNPPITLENDECYQHFSLYAQESLAEDRGKRARLRAAIVEDYLRSKAMFSLYPYGWHLLTGRVVHLHEYREPQIFSFQELDDEEIIEQVYPHLRTILDNHANVLVTLMPLYWDLYPELSDYRMTRKLMEEDPRIEVVVMRERMPIHLGEEEVKSWYNLPHDGHMSGKGGRLYAPAFATAIKEHLAKQGLLRPPR